MLGPLFETWLRTRHEKSLSCFVLAHAQRQMGMSRAQIQGSTDDFNNMAHNVDTDRPGHRPSEALEGMPGSREL